MNISSLPELNDEEYYWSDLIGLQVFTSDKTLLGVIVELLETGSNDVMVKNTQQRRLIPYTDQVVLKVDLPNQTMLVDWDDFLMDIDIITLFPEMFSALKHGVIDRAFQNQLCSVTFGTRAIHRRHSQQRR